jgi:hypothetical protein
MAARFFSRSCPGGEKVEISEILKSGLNEWTHFMNVGASLQTEKRVPLLNQLNQTPASISDLARRLG